LRKRATLCTLPTLKVLSLDRPRCQSTTPQLSGWRSTPLELWHCHCKVGCRRHQRPASAPPTLPQQNKAFAHLHQVSRPVYHGAHKSYEQAGRQRARLPQKGYRHRHNLFWFPMPSRRGRKPSSQPLCCQLPSSLLLCCPLPSSHLLCCQLLCSQLLSEDQSTLLLVPIPIRTSRSFRVGTARRPYRRSYGPAFATARWVGSCA
jgi:hypothetical protein